MSVAKILSLKGHAVVTTEADRTLHEASRLLAEYRIGAIVISGANGSVAGILSERDIVRAFAKLGEKALGERVGDHMTKKVMTCAAASSIHDVMETMSNGKFRHLPVLKEGRLDGMISIGDVVKHRLAELEQESASLREYITAS